MDTNFFLLLKDRVAIVTGAATGIGAAIAHRLACAQASVAVADLNTEAAAKAADLIRTQTNSTAFPVLMDVTEPVCVQEAVQSVLKRFGRVDIGSPEEIAAVVHFLASTDCSFVTGQCYDASGGRATY